METKTQEIARRRFTVHDYHRMAEAGILHEDDRVELIGGEIVEMTPIGALHATCVRELIRLLGDQVENALRVDVQNPVRLDQHTEPQPDLAVIRARNYSDSLPGSEDVLLLIEVSDTTLAYDRNVKLPLYARAGIGEVWIVNLPAGTVERHTDPSGDLYRDLKQARRGETLRSVALSGLALTVDDALG